MKLWGQRAPERRVVPVFEFVLWAGCAVAFWVSMGSPKVWARGGAF